MLVVLKFTGGDTDVFRYILSVLTVDLYIQEDNLPDLGPVIECVRPLDHRAISSALDEIFLMEIFTGAAGASHEPEVLAKELFLAAANLDVHTLSHMFEKVCEPVTTEHSTLAHELYKASLRVKMPAVEKVQSSIRAQVGLVEAAVNSARSDSPSELSLDVLAAAAALEYEELMDILMGTVDGEVKKTKYAGHEMKGFY